MIALLLLAAWMEQANEEMSNSLSLALSTMVKQLRG